MVNSIGGNNYGYYNYANSYYTKPNVAFKGETPSYMKVKKSKIDEENKKHADTVAGIMLAGGLLGLSSLALYVFTKGKKGTKGLAEGAEQAAKGTPSGNIASEAAGNTQKVTEGIEQAAKGTPAGSVASEAAGNTQKVKESAAAVFARDGKLKRSVGYEVKTKEDFEAIIGSVNNVDDLPLTYKMCSSGVAINFNKLPDNTRLELLDKLAGKVQKLSKKSGKPSVQLYQELITIEKAKILIKNNRKGEALQILNGLDKEKLSHSNRFAKLYLDCGQLDTAKKLVIKALEPHTKDSINSVQRDLVKTLSKILKAQSKKEDAEILEILAKGEYNFDQLTKAEIEKLVNKNIDYEKLLGRNGKKFELPGWVIEQYGK